MVPPNDTRERILDAGAQVIGLKGFNGCGLSEILKLAGVPKGSFYHHFESKEDMAIALIEKTSAEFQEWTQELLGDRRKPARERLRTLFERGRDECLTNGSAQECLIAKLALETGKLSDPVHAAVRCAYQVWTAILGKVLAEADAAGEITIDTDPDTLANILVMLWEGAAIRMEIERSPDPINACISFIFEHLLRPTD